MPKNIIKAVVDEMEDDRTVIHVDCDEHELAKLARQLGVRTIDDRNESGEIGLIMSTEELANAGITVESQEVRLVVDGILGDGATVTIEPGATPDEAVLVKPEDALYEVLPHKDPGVVDYD